MKKYHTYRRLAGIAVAAALSLGVGSPLGVAQVGDPKKAIKACKKKYG